MKYFILFALFTAGCSSSYEWVYDKTYTLDNVSPIGFAKADDGIWIANATGNTVLRVDKSGNRLEEIKGFSRPMHLDFEAEKLYIPEYLSDSVKVWQDGKMTALAFPKNPDAPAGIAVKGDDYLMADFYHHQLQGKVGGEYVVLGKKGKGLGELEYPTDVQFANGRLYIADAYNHRGQIWDANGTPIQLFGEKDGFNAATGIFVNAEQIFLTDFEHHRVLIYDLKGNLEQILQDQLKNPVEVLQFDKVLWIANFSGKSIAIYQKKRK